MKRHIQKTQHFFKRRTTLSEEAIRSLSYDVPRLEEEIEQLFQELGHEIPFPDGDLKKATDLEMDVLLSVLEAERAKKSDTSFLLTIFSSLIGIISVITTDLLENWSFRHLVTAVLVWMMLLMIVQKFYDHRMERLTLLSSYVQMYKTYRKRKDD